MQSLQDHAGQQCMASSASGSLMVPYAAYMLAPAQAQYSGSTVLAGQAMAPEMAGAAAAHAKARRHSFHLHPSTPGGCYAVTGASAGQFGAAQFKNALAGYSTPVPNGSEMPMCAPVAPRNLRADPRMRRFSAEVQGAGAAYAPYMQTTMNMQAAPGPMMYAQSQLYGSSAAQASSAHTGPAGRAASFGGRHDAAASRRSFDVRKDASVAGAGARQLLDVPRSSAAPNWAGPSWPKADNEASAPPAKNGTGAQPVQRL
jgi:hypothetical protein